MTVQQLICGREQVPDEPKLNRDNPNFDLWLPCSDIDRRDVKCADSWIPRHPQLLRLTGAHPFNSEPPHKDVVEHGWLTPVSKHLVRNHGAVPKLTWSTHHIQVKGMVSRPMALSMDELVKLPHVTVPCLVTCCGNRRKEVNMVKNSQGFSWGPGAVSVNWWTGVRLADVLRLVGAQTHEEGARFVQFTGPKGELPKGDDGSYGTSMPMTYAMDPANDVLIAFKQNGQYLHPDHGFPCRMLIPGWIGGRMVKWLSHITIAAEDSQNWYHIYDNKILPPHVNAEIAAAEGWWKDPDYVLYNLNINSTISHPGHDERVYLDKSAPYTMRGYAYSGGGRKITRVEVSFDGGKTFSKPCKLIVTEKPNLYGKYWTWVHWALEVTTAELFCASEIVCRAYDSSQNTQPAALTWSLLGQGNNCMFRLKVHRELDSAGRPCLRFQQPAPILPGELGNVGWREEEAAARASEGAPAAPKVAVKAVAAALDASKKYVTMEMVEKHDSDASVWFVYRGKVYDGTPFLKDHPGGADSILMVGGTDATEDFDAVHSDAAKTQLQQYYIADLAPKGFDIPASQLYTDGLAVNGSVAVESQLAADKPFLEPKRAKPAVLRAKLALSHDVILFRFALEHDKQRLGLPTGKHLLLRAYSPNAQGVDELVMRAYTPTTAEETLGHFDLVIKIYRKGVNPRFPDGGRMSGILEHLAVGQTIDVKGPIGHFHYLGRGRYLSHKVEGCASRMNMIAGGSGITPMYQVLKSILADPADATELRLLFANQTEADILLRSELDALQAQFPARLQVHYILSRPHAKWPGLTGRVTEAICRAALFECAPGTVSLMCGPPAMQTEACYPSLAAMGFEKGPSIIEF